MERTDLPLNPYASSDTGESVQAFNFQELNAAAKRTCCHFFGAEAAFVLSLFLWLGLEDFLRAVTQEPLKLGIVSVVLYSLAWVGDTVWRWVHRVFGAPIMSNHISRVFAGVTLVPICWFIGAGSRSICLGLGLIRMFGMYVELLIPLLSLLLATVVSAELEAIVLKRLRRPK